MGLDREGRRKTEDRRPEAEGDSPKSRERLAIRERKTEDRSLCRPNPTFLKGVRGITFLKPEASPVWLRDLSLVPRSR